MGPGFGGPGGRAAAANPTKAKQRSKPSRPSLPRCRSMDVSVSRVGLGLIWCGRQWPPNNPAWQRPSDSQIDAVLRAGFALLADADAGGAPQKLMLDTASGYGESEQRVGSWLTGNPALASRCVLATKFGETFDCATGDTTVCHTADGAMAQLEASALALGRPIDLFYSHITSQLTEAEAEAVLADEELRRALAAAKADGRVGLLGTSCSFPNVVRAALTKGWLEDITVVQLPSKTCVAANSQAICRCACL